MGRGPRVLQVSALLLVAAAGVSAQSGVTVSGTVTQASNNQPLSGALVVIDELRLEVRAGDDGTYRFENVPPGQVRAVYLFGAK